MLSDEKHRSLGPLEQAPRSSDNPMTNSHLHFGQEISLAPVWVAPYSSQATLVLTLTPPPGGGILTHAAREKTD